MRSKIAVVWVLLFSLFFMGHAWADDLLQNYMNNDTTKPRGQISYGMGVNLPAPSTATGGNVINLSTGASATSSCGLLDLPNEIKTVFSAEALNNYVQGIESAAINGAPMLLTCYASQTLCDLMKHFRSMANAVMSMRHAQCAQIESLAAKAGSSLRNNAIMDCVTQQISSNGGSYDQALQTCSTQGQFTLNFPGTNLSAGADFSLTDALGKLGVTSTSNPALNNLINGVIGDVHFNAGTGISTQGQKAQYAIENQVGQLTNKYYQALHDVAETAVATRTMPAASDLQTVSTPGVPISPLILTRLAAIDP